MRELEKAPKAKYSKMLDLVSRYSMVILPSNIEAERLAGIYVSEDIVPAKFSTDALHIAITAVNDLDFIVSYNFKHIVKRKTVIMTRSVNVREGYKQIDIFSPTEVVENE